MLDLKQWRLNQQHFAKFMAFCGDSTPWEGARSPRRWGYYATGIIYPKLSERPLERDELVALARNDSGLDDLEVFLSVMAWGGMNVAFGRSTWKHRNLLQPIIQALRRNTLSRSATYAAFSAVLSKLEKPGMGPAYFTKLISFCDPAQRSYSMDQWTARSINLLFASSDGSERKPVRLDSTRVSPGNTPSSYEQFCHLIEVLRDMSGMASGAAVEEKLFSNGAYGRERCGRWRRYVIGQTSTVKLPAGGA